MEKEKIIEIAKPTKKRVLVALGLSFLVMVTSIFGGTEFFASPMYFLLIFTGTVNLRGLAMGILNLLFWFLFVCLVDFIFILLYSLKGKPKWT